MPEMSSSSQHVTLKDSSRVGPPTQDSVVIEITPPDPVEGDNVILQIREELMENVFPRPILLWTNDIVSGLIYF